MMEKKVLLIECPDSKGLIAQITNICYKHQLNIIRNTEYVDPDSGQFFMRTQLEGIFNDNTLMLDLDRALPHGSSRQLVAAGRKKVVILVTKEAHCLGDILMKVYDGSLKLDIAAVVGNHPDLQSLSEKFDIPYHFVSHINLSREHKKLLDHSPFIKLIASGGVSSMKDIKALAKLNIRSVVVGKAIYENRISIEEIKEWNLKAMTSL